MKSSVSHLLVATLLLGGCADFDEPEPLNPAPVLGCYNTPNAPFLKVESNGVSIAQMAESVPFSYHQAKVGMILVMPVEAQIADDRFKFVRSEDHYYRVIHLAGGPVIQIAFGPDGVLRNYQRGLSTDCEI